MDNNANALGRRIQVLRESNMMTRADLAQHMGVTRKEIVDWEEGRALPTAEQVVAVARFFSADPRALLDVEDGAVPAEQPTAPPPKAGKRLVAGLLCLALGLCAALGASALMGSLSAEGESVPASSTAEELPAPLPESLPLTALPAAEWDLDGDGEKELVCLEGQALFFRMEEDGPAAYALAQPLPQGQTLTAQDGVFVLAASSGRSRIYSVFRDGALWPAG
ncbi:MAG: helix-turn-helix transcriptional regulator [Oscillospiraceae bacterium]|nr:helix-turn-helix transcriptional regulator [Oscillospiraceae bacterium]